MKNIYQAVLDDAERRRKYGGYEPSPQMLEKVKEYLRKQEEKRVERIINGGKGERRGS